MIVDEPLLVPWARLFRSKFHNRDTRAGLRFLRTVLCAMREKKILRIVVTKKQLSGYPSLLAPPQALYRRRYTEPACSTPTLSPTACPNPPHNLQRVRHGFGLTTGLIFSTRRPGSALGVRTGGGGGVGVWADI